MVKDTIHKIGNFYYSGEFHIMPELYQLVRMFGKVGMINLSRHELVDEPIKVVNYYDITPIEMNKISYGLLPELVHIDDLFLVTLFSSNGSATTSKEYPFFIG